ncbi:MAG: Hsp70 family protein, partial [Nitrospirota bacterium]|nr:Hsp70 family protein [Nitrospirota bacterium]
EDAVERLVNEAEANATSGHQRRKFIELKNEAHELVYSAEKTLVELPDDISEDGSKALELATKSPRDCLNERLRLRCSSPSTCSPSWPARWHERDSLPRSRGSDGGRDETSAVCEKQIIGILKAVEAARNLPSERGRCRTDWTGIMGLPLQSAVG